MLDRLLKWGVDYLLKDYVIIDPNQAKTNILEGKIEFENLELRPDLLQKIGVPGYSLRAGHIGKLLVHISPWHYATEPGYVTIDGIFLLIVPSHAIKVDKKTKAENKVQDKLRTLAKIEEMRAQKLDDDSTDNQSKKESKDGFILRQVMAIVRNLQISIGNIHVRLEDASTDPTCKVSLGLSLESLTLNTCNSNWEERLVTESSDSFFKIAKLRSLAVYFTTHSKLYSEQAAAESKSLKVVLRGTIAREGRSLPPAFHYILKPLSSDAKVWSVPNPKRCKPGQAQFFLDMVVHDVAILASKQQVHCAIALAESTDLLRMKNKYKKFRPVDMSNPTVKWKFALQCILVKTIRPKRDVWKWENIKWHRETFKKYRAIMEKTYSNANFKLTEVELVEKRIAEEKLDVFNLDLARRLAQQTVKLTKEALAKEQKKKKSGGWFSSWYGSGSSESSKKAAAVEESMMLEIQNSMEDTQNKAELYKALGVDDSDDPFAGNYSLLPKDFIQLEVGVALREFSINFVDVGIGDVTQSVCKVSVHQFKTSLWRQPVTDYVKVKVDLGKLNVDGTLPPGQDPKTSKAPALVSMLQQNSQSSLATLVVELNPLSMPTVDFYVQVRSQSVQVIYDILTVQSLVDYFKTKHEATLVANDVKDAANRQMKKFNHTSAAGVMFLLEKHKVIFLDVDLEPSFALIPSVGKIDPNEPVVIFKTGHLKVVTKNKSHFGRSASSTSSKSITRSATFDELKEKPYDSFECTLSQVQLFYLHRSVNWEQVAFNPDSSESLVKPIKLTLDIHKCLVSDDPEFPLVKLNGALEDLAVTISDMTMIRLMKFLKDMKFPKTSSSSGYVQEHRTKNVAPYLQYAKRAALDSLDDINQIDNFLPLASEVEKEKKKDESPTKQLTLVKLDYTIQRVAILLLEDGSLPTGVTNRLLSAELKNLSINLLKKTYEIPVTLSLESVSLIHQQFNYGDAPLRLLETKTTSSNDDETLVLIRIRIAERNSPVFHTEYESVEFLVDAVVQSVRVRLHQEAILSAMAFQQNLMSRMFPNDEAPQSNDVTEIEVPTSSQSTVESMEVIDRYNKMLARERKTKLVQLRLFASLKETDVLVSSQKISHDIADIKLKTMQTFVEVIPSETVKFTASLEYFKIKDPFTETMYPDILSVRGSQVFSLEVIYFFSATKGESYADMEKSDLMCKLKTGTPRVVYIHRWVDSVLQFLSHFQTAQQKLKSVGSSAARGTADLANIVHEKAFRIKLDLEISAPFVVIPQNSHSTHVLYANLGQLNVKNIFRKIDVASQLAVLDSMNVKLDDVKVTRALIDNKGYVAAECHLLEPSVMSIDVIRNLTPKLYKEQSGIEINGKIVNLTTSVGQADIQLVYEILLGNFGEVKPKPAVTAAPRKRKSSSSRGRSPHKKGASSRGSSVQSRGDGSASASAADESFGESEKAVDKLVTLKASFEIESVCAQLFSDRIKLEKGLETRDMNASLGKFELVSLRVNTTMHSDGDMVFHADMMNCTLDDTRTFNNSSIVRMIERKQSNGKESGSDRRSRDSGGSGDMSEGSFLDKKETLMISFDYEKEGAKEERIELKVNNMYICVCTDFLMSIADFFLKNRPTMPANETEKTNQAEKALTAPLDTIQEEPSDLNSNEVQTLAPKGAVTDEPVGPSVTRIISVSFQNPEIVLVSDTREDSSPCLILTWKVQSSLVMRPMELKITALVKDIEILCCPFKHSLRAGNTKQVIPAFTIHAFANQSETSKQQNMNVEMDPVEINISPAVIKVIQAVAQAMSMHQSISDSDEVYGVTDALWAPKFISDEDIAFLKSPVTQSTSKISAVDSPPEVVSSESAFLDASKIVIKFDISDSTGITQPIILLQSSLFVRIENYISRDRLQIEADFSIGMNYFNDLVNAWEPVIEPSTYISDKGIVKSEAWTIRAEIARGCVTTESSIGDVAASDWLVELSAQRSLELTVTSRFLYSLNVINEAFKGSSQYVNDSRKAGLYGDMAPYAIVNDSGRDLAVLISNDFTTKGRGTSVSDDGTSLVTLSPQDKIELVPNSNMSTAQYRRLTSKSSFVRSASLENSNGTNEEEFAQVAFDIIVPGSETIRSVSLTKPGYHFYNILPLSEYRFSLVVRNGLDDTGHQNVCTISSSLILFNHFDIPFDVYYERENLGSMQPGKQFHVPMLQAFHPGESRLFIIPTVDESGIAKWGACSQSIDWRTLKKSGNGTRFLINKCPPLPQPNGFAVLNPLRMILKLDSLKLGTVHGELRDTPHYVIHVKPTCIIRNLSPYPIYYRVKVTDKTVPRPYKMLMYGQQELIYETELGVTKMDIDITDHRDIRFIGMMTLKKQGKPITHGQWFDCDKKESIVMGVCWTYDETDFLILSIFAPYWIVNRLDRDLFLKRADDERVMTHPASFKGISLFTPSAKDNVDKVKMCIRVDNTLFSEPLNIQAVGNAELASCPRRNGGDLLVGVTNTLSRMRLSKIIVLTPNYILLNNTKYDMEYAQFFPTQVENQDWAVLKESAVLGIWPSIPPQDADKKSVYLMLRRKQYKSMPFLITRSDDFLLRVAQIGCLHISVSVSESATTITVNTYFPGAAPAKLFNLTDRQILYWQNTEVESQNDRSGLISVMPKFLASKFDSDVSSSSSSNSDSDECSDKLRKGSLKTWDADVQNQMWSQKTYVLTAGNHTLFTWPDPTAQRTLYYRIEGQVLKNGKSEGEEGSRFDLTKDTFQEVVCECPYNSGEKSRKYYVSSMLCRQQRVLIFTDDHCLATGTKYDDDYEDYCNVEQQLHEKFSYDVILSLYGFGLSLVNNTINKQVPKEIFYAGITPTEVTWMYYGKGKKHWVPFSMNNNNKIEDGYQKYLQNVKTGAQPGNQTYKLGEIYHTFDFSKKPMLLTVPDRRKVKRTYLHGIFIQYQQSPNVAHFQFKMNRLQIDDPLPTCMFPVVFAPVPPPKSIIGEREPIAFIQASIVMQRGSGQLILFKYAKVLIQEFSIKVDTTFLGALQSFFSGNEIKTDVEKYLALDFELAETPLNKTEAVQVACDTLRHYYQDLNLGPIKLLLSLSLAKGENDSGLLGINNSFVDGLAQTFGVVLTEQHDTCIKLAYFERKNRFLTFKQLTNQAKKFYTNQIVRQFYYFFANLDAMGNPQKLLLGIKEGGTDLFYEPYQGAILGPAEFVEGLGIGVKSLGSHAIGGVFGVASSVTASAGQAIAFLSFDEKHKQERRKDMRDKPQHVGQGLTKGFKRLGSGVFGGVTGVITQPIQGVKKDGAKGFVTGIGKGAAGLVVKPVGGVVDLASNAFEGIRGSADSEVALNLLRTPRVVRCDHIVRAYDAYEAKGNEILKELQIPLMRYSGHVFTKKDCKGVVIVTQKALVHAEKKALVVGAFEKWDILTTFFFRDIVSFPQIQFDDDTFKIEMKGDKKGETRTKIVTVQAACKKFLRDRATQSFQEFCKRQKSND